MQKRNEQDDIFTGAMIMLFILYLMARIAAGN